MNIYNPLPVFQVMHYKAMNAFRVQIAETHFLSLLRYLFEKLFWTVKTNKSLFPSQTTSIRVLQEPTILKMYYQQQKYTQQFWYF